MQIVVIGMNHKSAPLPVRERVAFVPSELPAFYQALRARVPEGFLLTTCNRTEIYALAGHAESGSAALSSLLAEQRGFPLEELDQYVYRRGFEDAIHHLFAVASGVDSMVPGEEQILTQLRQALQHARAHGALGPVLHRLGASALAAGKRVRAETTISRHSLSVVSVALHAANMELGGLRGRRVLIVGAGHTARLALRHLDRVGAIVTVCNRTEATASGIAAPHGAGVVNWSELAGAVAEADVVLGCTNAPEIVLDAATVRRAMVHRSGRPLLIIDLAVPRDVESTVAAIDGVYLMDLDRLEALSSDNHRSRTAEIASAEGIIVTAVERFMTWWNARQVAPTITTMLAMASEIRDREVERALARMPELASRDRQFVRILGARIVAQLFHQPMRTLKISPEGANLAWALQELFGLPKNPSLVGPGMQTKAIEGAAAPAEEAACPHESRSLTSAE